MNHQMAMWPKRSFWWQLLFNDYLWSFRCCFLSSDNLSTSFQSRQLATAYKVVKMVCGLLSKCTLWQFHHHCNYLGPCHAIVTKILGYGNIGQELALICSQQGGTPTAFYLWKNHLAGDITLRNAVLLCCFFKCSLMLKHCCSWNSCCE
jgi:hypothetical protein